MFEKQCQSGIDKLKAPSSTMESPPAATSDAIEDSPAKSEMQASKVDDSKTEPDPAKNKTSVEESLPALDGKHNAPESQASENPESHASVDDTQASKRQRTEG